MAHRSAAFFMLLALVVVMPALAQDPVPGPPKAPGPPIGGVPGLDAKLDRVIDEIGGLRDDLTPLLPPEPALGVARPRWVSPLWLVLEGSKTTRVTVLNPHPTRTIIVRFNFYDRDGVFDTDFSTNRLVPPRATARIELDDTGVTPPRSGWVLVDADGPVLPEGELFSTRGTRELGDRTDTARTMTWYPM